MLFLAVILSLPLYWAPVDAQSTGDPTCQDVHLFLARGDAEEYPGRIGDIATDMCSQLDNCDYEDIVFTTVQGSEYCPSVSEGASNGVSQITAYNKKCPDAKLVVAGYSLGSHVVGDILGGGGGDFYNCVEAYTSSNLNPSMAPGNMIAAALQFGDVRYTSGQSYNMGTGSSKEGKYPRSGSQLESLNLFADKLHSYCLTTDPICAQGDDGESHTTYMQVYGEDAASWAVQMINGGGSSQSSSVSSAAPTEAAATSSSTQAATSSSTEAPTTSSSSSPSSSSSSPSSPSSTTSSSSSSEPSSSAAAASTSVSPSSSSSPATSTALFPVAAETSSAPSSSATGTSSTPLSGGAKIGIAVGAVGVVGALAGLFAFCIISRRRQRKANAAGVDETGTHYPKPAGMLERDTSYSRVAAQEAAQGLAPPQVVHDWNRDSNGTMSPLVRYGDINDARSSHFSDNISNAHSDDRYSRYSDDISDARY